MPRKARIHYVSLRSSLVNLPVSIYGPLLERGVRPQGLAVHLTLVQRNNQSLSTNVEAYVGWTGMASASSLAHFNSTQSGDAGFETIEIDPQFSQGLGLLQGDIVEIGLLHDLGHAQSVATEPVTSDDWEIIEIHASHVEYTLLSQVRVAKIGQEIDVWVLGRTRVRLTVTGLEPQTKGNALLLTTNTEVSIMPKLHRTNQAIPKKQLAHGKPLAAIEKETQVATIPSPSDAVVRTFRVLPLRFSSGVQFPEYTGSEFLAFISRRSLEDPFPSNCIDHQGNTEFYQARFRRMPPPPDPSSTTGTSPPPEPAPRILNASGGDKSSEAYKPSASKAQELYVGPRDDLPFSHVVFSALPEDVEEWDLVRISVSPSSEPLKLQQHDSSTPLDSPALPISSTPYLAGVSDILIRCTNHCIREYLSHSTVSSVHGVSGLLVTGRAGAGKTSIVRAIAKNLQENPETLAYIIYVDVSRHVEQPIGAVKALFNHWFDQAAWHRPSVLVLDNLDKLLSAEVEHVDSFRSRLLTEVFLRIFSSGARTSSLNCRGITLVATASSVSALHPRLNSSHVFKEVVNVKPPDKNARRDILSRIVEGRLDNARDIRLNLESPVNFTALATQTEGYSASDLQDLVARAFHEVAMRLAKEPVTYAELTYADFSAAQAGFIPLNLRDVKLETSDISWNDIGGLFEVKKILRETLEWPTKYGPIFKQAPLRLRSGLLLYGYPGCGKTLLASAVAKECGLNFISVKGPEILNKYIGASEKSVRDLFERASSAKPCVLFFDEFDSIAPKRGHDSTGVTDRVVNQMLTQMDGAEGLEGVYVLAATSRPDLIDSALLRPGRLDKSLLCNLPDFTERKDILSAVAKKLTVSPSVNFDDIAGATQGYSGADLQALLYNAHLDVIHAAINSAPSTIQTYRQNDEKSVKYHIVGGISDKKIMSKAEETAFQRRLRQIQVNSSKQKADSQNIQSDTTTQTKHEIDEASILKALKSTRPSVSIEEQRRLERIYNAFVSDRSGELPVPPEAGGIGIRATLG